MSWPPWWLILAWIVIVPLGIRMLVNPMKIWSRPRREWAEDHPGDGYSSGWLAQTEFQAILGLGIVALCTVAWLVHGHHSAHADPVPKTETDAAGAVAVMPDPYELTEPTAKGLRLNWHSYGDSADCPFDHVKVDETAKRVTVTVYETPGTSFHCNVETKLTQWSGDQYTDRHNDVALQSPLGGRTVVNGDGEPVQTVEQSRGQ